MITRRRFINASAATLAMGSAGAGERDAPLFAVGLIADAQYVDADPGGIRHYRNSIEKLASAAKSINEAEVDFSIHLGDLIDRDFASFDRILEPLSELKSPVFQIPGNHDFSVTDAKKPGVFGKLGMTKPYHSFSKDAFRFVFLDGTEISTFAHPRDSDVFKEASEILKEFEAEGRKNAKSWNGTISGVQLEWLEGELAAAKAAGEKVIISCHYPILPDNSHNLWSDREVLAVIDRFPGTVAAWFNGHNHAGNYAERNGVHYVTVQGMVDTEHENAFAILEVSPELLTIRGSGRVPSRELKIG
ncbi:metallophosphoesterase [Verrucomicrobiales bacterium BCK34]|nr:metallophosphoesterase [Verrucomicrobiales bacterium BCK34]